MNDPYRVISAEGSILVCPDGPVSSEPYSYKGFPPSTFPGKEGGPHCVCVNCFKADPATKNRKVMLNGTQWGCVVFAVEGEKGIVVQRMPKMPDDSEGLNWRIQIGKVEFLPVGEKVSHGD